MSKADDDDEQSDYNLFKKEVNGVRPLKQDKIKPFHTRRRPIPIQFVLNEKAVIDDMMSDEIEMDEVETGEELFFARTGLQSKVIRKLKRGQYSLEAELDLHGMSVVAAREAILGFLHECQQDNCRCVRIIHGKGLSSKHKGPVLKQMVNRWLRQRKEVLAYTSAIPRHGGTGAVYVLLKRM